jgi:hypothetical protein
MTCTWGEISASISWGRESGFYMTLGSPIFAELSVRSISDAIGWLREQALDYYPIAILHASIPGQCDVGG